MGFLNNVVAAVVTVVENATGNENSGAGDWTEEQAAQAEAAVDEAMAAVADATADVLDFGQRFGSRFQGQLGSWLLGAGGHIGLTAPTAHDLNQVLGLGADVLDLTARRVENWAEQKVPGPVADLGARLPGMAARGPAALWAEVKTELHGGTVFLGRAGGRLRDKGAAIGSKVADTAGKVGHWGADKCGAIGVKVIGTAGQVGHWGEDKLAHAQTLDKVRHWGDRLGARVNDTSPADTVRELARRADDERARLVDALRRAAATVPPPVQPVRPAGHAEPLQRARSRRPESIEWRRLAATLEAAASAGKGGASQDTARHLAAAAEAAVRSAVLQAQLLLWLAAIRRLSQHRRRSVR